MTKQNAFIRGFVDKEPILRQTNTGEFYATASVRTYESTRAANGQELKSKPEWHPVKVWGEEKAKAFNAAVSKGMYVEVEGPLQTSKYKDAKGVEHRVYAIEPKRFEEVSRDLKMKNSYSIEGRLGDDPKFGVSSSGHRYAVMSVAVNENGYNDNRRTQWINVMTSSQELVDTSQALKKGNEVKMEGMLRSSEYKTRDREQVYSFSMLPNSIELLQKDKGVGESKDLAKSQEQASTVPPAAFQNSLSANRPLQKQPDEKEQALNVPF